MKGRTRSTSVNIPDSIKIATLLNETKEALQQHLKRLYTTMSGRASPSTTGQQHHSQGCNKSKSFDPNTTNQHTTSQGPAPMDIGAAYNSSDIKEKEKKRGTIRKEKASIKAKDTNSSYSNKGKGNPFKGASKGKGKYPPNNMKGQGKSKGKDTCYKCGQQGHIAKN